MKRLIVFLLLLPMVMATTIEQAEVTAEMGAEDTHVIVEYLLNSDIEENIILRLPLDAQEIKVSVDGEPRNCTISRNEEDSLARCGDTRDGNMNVLLEYSTAELRGELGEQTIIKYTDKLQYKADQYRFELKLPKGYIIPDENKQDFYLNPEPQAVLSDGQRIIIQWEADSVTRFSATAIAQSIIKKETNIVLLIGIALGACIITLLAVLGFTLLKPKKQDETERIEEVAPSFIESEQKVVDILRKAENNTLWQKQIQQECGFNKVKLSRILRNLEARGVVIKESYGNTNKIALKKNGHDDKDSEEEQ